MERERIHHIHKIIIFTLDSLYSGVALHELVKTFPERVVLICVSKRYGKKYGTFWQQLKRNWKRSGFTFVEYLSFHFVYYYFMVYLGAFINKILGREQKVYSVKQLSKKYGIPILKTNNPNDPEIVSYFKKIDPDLIVSAYFDHVIRKPVIDLPKFGVINVHTALLPDYRGPFPPLWPILRKEKVIGVTIHYINSERLDAGPILAEKKCFVEKNESVLGVDCRLMKEGINLIKDIVVKIENGTATSIPQEERGSGKYYSYPTKDDLKNMHIPLFTLKDFFSQFF